MVWSFIDILANLMIECLYLTSNFYIFRWLIFNDFRSCPTKQQSKGIVIPIFV